MKTALLLFISATAVLGRTAPEQLAESIFRELIEINTADSAANVTGASEAVARRMRAAGFSESDIHVDGDDPHFKNIVVRLRGTGKARPILLLAHLDVVEARRTDWSLDPFHFTEKDGYFYGRGTVDDKAEAACWLANLILYKQEGLQPSRDIIVALTSGEEGGAHNGVDWLLKNHRDWIDAEFALNEGGDGILREGKKIANYVQASEKVYYSVELKATNPGGHSSLPRPDNAIYSLTEALLKLKNYRFPPKLNQVTKLYFERTGPIAPGKLGAAMRAIAANPQDEDAERVLSADAHENAILRTTCVPTRLLAGHADNALPQVATALVNCRLLPEDKPEDVLATLRKVVDNPQLEITAMNVPRIGPTSPITASLMSAVEQTTSKLWPGVPVIPIMSTGATDGRALRQAGIATYGVSGFFLDENDNREHGRDERIGVTSFFEGRQFLYDLVKKLAE